MTAIQVWTFEKRRSGMNLIEKYFAGIASSIVEITITLFFFLMVLTEFGLWFGAYVSYLCARGRELFQREYYMKPTAGRTMYWFRDNAEKVAQFRNFYDLYLA
jgi:hypothetical protein